MSEQNNKLPIGLLLQHAGLISDKQLNNALELQAQYPQMKLGEILVLQEGLRIKTINFFVDRWQDVVDEGQTFPIGYYLSQACLLTEKQVEIILQEQKNNQQKFGQLAVEKRWIEQETINFFIDNLSLKPPKLMSLNQLEEYDRNTLRLDKKYANYSLILSRILGWTGGIPNLTKTIAQTFAKSNSNIPKGSEIQAVDRFVEGTLIRKWQTSKAAASIRAVRDSLLNNSGCTLDLLLSEYQDILFSGDKADLGSREQEELLLLGLVVRENDRLKVSNIIYQQIFDREFIVEQLNKLQPENTAITTNKTTTVDSTNSIIEYASQASIEPGTSIPKADEVEVETYKAEIEPPNTPVPNASPEPLTRVGSIITCTAIALLIPLFLTINSYYSSLSKPQQTVLNTNKKADRLKQSCEQISFTDTNTILSSILNLEASRQQLANDFPERCRTVLNQLRVIAAPQLGKESRILEAIRHLCNVPADSEMYIEAEVWLKRWYNSADWGEETKFYLQERNKYNDTSCPAAHFTEYES